MVKRVVLDAGLIIEYIVARSPYRFKVARLFDIATAGNLELYGAIC